MSEASTQALEVALSSDQLVDVIEHNTQVAVGFILKMMSTATIDTCVLTCLSYQVDTYSDTSELWNAHR